MGMFSKMSSLQREALIVEDILKEHIRRFLGDCYHVNVEILYQQEDAIGVSLIAKDKGKNNVSYIIKKNSQLTKLLVTFNKDELLGILRGSVVENDLFKKVFKNLRKVEEYSNIVVTHLKKVLNNGDKADFDISSVMYGSGKYELELFIYNTDEGILLEKLISEDSVLDTIMGIEDKEELL